MIISYQLKVFHGQSEVTFGEFEYKKLIFSLKLEFYQKRSQPPILVTEIQSYKTETKKMSKNVSESILHGRIIFQSLIFAMIHDSWIPYNTFLKTNISFSNCRRWGRFCYPSEL